MAILESIAFWIKAYAVVLSLIGIVAGTRKLRQLWRTRHLRRVWGIKNGQSVIVVCSELDDPEKRQLVEPREFIYSVKYGDVDAYFEVVISLLRLYPSIRLRVMSAGEAASTRMDLGKHLILIGGPDYNAVTRQVLSWNVTQFDYRSPDSDSPAVEHPEEIVLYDGVSNREYCYTTDVRDYGYFERLVNPHNPDRSIILIGGCHTIGVTGAVKAFSMAESEEGEIPRRVLNNAAMVAGVVGRERTFSVMVAVERVGQTISVPVVRRDHITVRAN